MTILKLNVKRIEEEAAKEALHECVGLTPDDGLDFTELPSHKPIYATDKAVLVEVLSGEMLETERIWLPLSQIRLKGDKVYIPDWLAREKGFIE